MTRLTFIKSSSKNESMVLSNHKARNKKTRNSPRGPETLMDPLQKLAETLAKASRTPKIKLQMRIDYFIITHDADDNVQLLETTRPVIPVKTTPNINLETIAIDGASTAITLPTASIAVATVHVASTRIIDFYTHPPPAPQAYKPLLNPPYIAVGTPEPVPQTLYEHGITDRNPLGDRYTLGYSPERMADELRSTLENWALGEPAAELAMTLSNYQDAVPVVIVDGPLYPSPSLIGTAKGSPEHVWQHIRLQRITAIDRLEKSGIPVVGIVKRVERSRVLASGEGYRKLVARCGIEPGEGSFDVHLLYTLLSRERCRGRGLYYRTPLAVSKTRYGDTVVSTYIAVPMGVNGYRVYRLETTRKSLEILRDWGLRPWDVYALDSIARESIDPVTLARADRIASRTASYVSRRLREALGRAGAPLPYEWPEEVV